MECLLAHEIERSQIEKDHLVFNSCTAPNQQPRPKNPDLIVKMIFRLSIPMVHKLTKNFFLIFKVQEFS